MIRLPAITHLQYALLRAIAGTDGLGETVRADVRWSGSLPGFYQAMGRLERKGLLVSQAIRFPQRTASWRRYRPTTAGLNALRQCEQFYRQDPAEARA